MTVPQRNIPLPSLGLFALTVAGFAIGSDLILQLSGAPTTAARGRRRNLSPIVREKSTGPARNGDRCPAPEWCGGNPRGFRPCR